MSTLDTTELDQQIAAAEQAAAELRNAKQAAENTARNEFMRSEIYRKQQDWIAQDDARRKQIVDEYDNGPQAALLAKAQALAPAELAFREKCVQLAELVAQVEAMKAELNPALSSLLNRRYALLLEAVQAFADYAWGDVFAHFDPKDPDTVALASWTKRAAALFPGDDLTSPHLADDQRNTAALIAFQRGNLADTIRRLRDSHEWADATPKAQHLTHQREIEQRKLGMLPQP